MVQLDKLTYISAFLYVIGFYFLFYSLLNYYILPNILVTLRYRQQKLSQLAHDISKTTGESSKLFDVYSQIVSNFLQNISSFITLQKTKTVHYFSTVTFVEFWLKRQNINGALAEFVASTEVKTGNWFGNDLIKDLDVIKNNSKDLTKLILKSEILAK